MSRRPRSTKKAPQKRRSHGALATLPWLALAGMALFWPARAGKGSQALSAAALARMEPGRGRSARWPLQIPWRGWRDILRRFAAPNRFNVLDLGVGSGAILLAILAERPAAKGLGIDVSEDALAVARENAANLGLAGRTALLRGDWTAGLDDDGFDLVVANPPYVRSSDIETLDPEVRDYEPRLALDGGEDGLDAYRRLAPEILRVLKPGGGFLVEIGHDQAEAVKSLFAAAGAVDIRLTQDLAGHDRIVAGSKKPLGIAANNR